MYLAGDSGTGKTTYAMNALNKYAAKKGNHKDWCYVYNFENNREPLIIGLEKGLGKIFKKDIEKLIETLLDELRDAFESEDFEIGKNQLIEEYEIEKDALLKKIKKYAEEKGFKLKNSKVGMVFIPIDDNKEDESPLNCHDINFIQPESHYQMDKSIAKHPRTSEPQERGTSAQP